MPNFKHCEAKKYLVLPVKYSKGTDCNTTFEFAQLSRVKVLCTTNSKLRRSNELL
uniref:Uncharacterized protein n=1 Tax=Anguilla anguilla TaxID=7936 RepID=A0A0E9RFZ1_ANGAN